MERQNIYWDTDQRLPGRGAYVHPRFACIGTLRKVQLLGRALRIKTEMLRSDQIGELVRELHGYCTAIENAAIEHPSNVEAKRFSARNVRLLK